MIKKIICHIIASLSVFIYNFYVLSIADINLILIKVFFLNSILFFLFINTYNNGK